VEEIFMVSWDTNLITIWSFLKFHSARRSFRVIIKLFVFNKLLVSCGDEFTVILTESFSVYSTGENSFGQLGITHTVSVGAFTKIELYGTLIKNITCGKAKTFLTTGISSTIHSNVQMMENCFLVDGMFMAS
jgi:alpha-tubulin suppressor-like RCC1 family protein